MDFEILTLGFLKSSPKTGYRMQEIAGKMALDFNISMNQVYPALRKLEEKALVKKETVIQTGRPNKNVYSITDEGQEYFSRRLTAPHEPFDFVLDFLVRVLFFRYLSEEQVANEFEKEICSLQEQIDDIIERGKKVNEKADKYGKICYRTALHLLRSLRDFYAEELECIKNEKTR